MICIWLQTQENYYISFCKIDKKEPLETVENGVKKIRIKFIFW